MALNSQPPSNYKKVQGKERLLNKRRFIALKRQATERSEALVVDLLTLKGFQISTPCEAYAIKDHSACLQGNDIVSAKDNTECEGLKREKQMKRKKEEKVIY